MSHAQSSASQEHKEHSPPPPRPTYRILQAMLVLAIIYTLYFGRSLIMPIVVALLLTLLLSPVVNLLKRFHIPRIFSALVLLFTLSIPFTLLVSELSEPVQRWAQLIPELSQKLSERLEALESTLGSGEELEEQLDEESRSFFSNLFGGASPDNGSSDDSDRNSPMMERITQGGIELTVYFLSAAPLLLTQLITCLTVTIFLLVFGSALFDAIIRHLPQIENKEGAQHIVGSVQRELSRYILTVSAINALLGLTVGSLLWLVGVEDALLWGVMVAMLNYAPYVGLLIGVAIISFAGFAQFGASLFALLPPAIYLTVNSIEAQYVTPTVLGHQMRLNPLLLMLWLIFWAWLWGFVGVLLAVPLLVCVKIAVSELDVPQHWVKILETKG